MYPKIYLNISANQMIDGGNDGVTILYFPQTMIDDGIYGSLGIKFTKDKNPEYILGLSFPVGHWQ